MATKLGTTTYELSALEIKYGNYMAPYCEVLLDGTKIPDTIAITSVRVETSIESTADSFSIRIADAYDLEESQIKWLDKFKLGLAIEIKLGYVDKCSSVFSGYITSVVADIPDGEPPGIIVRGLDLSYSMMKGTKSRSWNEKKYSDIVTEIAGEHGATAQVDATTTLFPFIAQSRIDDFHFIQYLATLVNYDFFFVGKNLYFRKPNTETSPVVTLKYGTSIRHLSIDMNLADQITGVKVRGWDSKELKLFEGISGTITKLGGGSKTGADIMKTVGSGKFDEYIYTNVSSADEANSYASAVLGRRSMKLVTGSGECVGFPEMQAGRYAKLEGLGKSLNGLYYLTAVTHNLDGDGYFTRFQIGRNAL
jgi:phage protein D